MGKRKIKRVKALWDSWVEIRYNPNVHGFGVFLEIGFDGSEDYHLAEIPPKQARKLAKAILKATKKGK